MRVLIRSATVIWLLSLFAITSSAKGYRDCSYMCDSGEQYNVECTAYCDSTNKTATGTDVRLGICAFSPTLYGKTALIWTEDGEFLGYFDIEDTGSRRIRNGEVIDIWLPTYDECIEFGRQNVVIEIWTMYG